MIRTSSAFLVYAIAPHFQYRLLTLTLVANVLHV
jgi:hypothetical protein